MAVIKPRLEKIPLHKNCQWLVVKHFLGFCALTLIENVLVE